MDSLNFGNVLGRSEMKKLMAGSGECALYCNGCTIRCGTTPCYVSGDTLTCNGQVYDCNNPNC